ncbi:MAG: GntR family transcriptional regulator [Abditibacteriota bacterium]|nr:GntR family transcriptional regulator [Abditibacteriota bacterium]
MKDAKYELLTEELRRKIRDGSLRPGDMLMSRSRMEKHYGISATTINRALDVLEREGLITRRQGKGCFVAEREYGGSNVVAIICPINANPSKTDISPFLVNAIVAALKDTGFLPVLFDSEDPEAGFASAMEQQAAGIFIVVTDMSGVEKPAERAQKAGVPVIFLDKKGRGGGYVATDHYTGARLAVEKAISLGYTRIYHLCDKTGVSSVDERKLGYAHAMTMANLNTRLIPVDVSRAAYISRFYEAMKENRDILDEKCALFTSNGDGMTGVWRAVWEIAPREYPALISFDDPDIVLPEGVPFINIVQDLQKIGAEAVRMLLANVLEGKPLEEVRIRPEIINGSRL